MPLCMLCANVCGHAQGAGPAKPAYPARLPRRRSFLTFPGFGGAAARAWVSYMCTAAMLVDGGLSRHMRNAHAVVYAVLSQRCWI